MHLILTRRETVHVKDKRINGESDFNPLVPRVQKTRISKTRFITDFTGFICEGNSIFDTLLLALETNADPTLHNIHIHITFHIQHYTYNICFFKTINYIEVQRYLFGINGLKFEWLDEF